MFYSPPVSLYGFLTSPLVSHLLFSDAFILNVELQHMTERQVEVDWVKKKMELQLTKVDSSTVLQFEGLIGIETVFMALRIWGQQ